MKTSRRDLLRTGALGAAATLLPWGCAPAPAPTAGDGLATAAGADPDFTAAFLTDMHVNAENGSAAGLAQAVRNAMDRPREPELMITGGDLAMDILATTEEAADEQYALFEAEMQAVGVPLHHTMGNHDMLGVYEQSGLAPDHPRYGKAYFRERFGGGTTYHSFDHEGWHFVLLDSLDIRDRAYIGWIDEEQIAWLDDDLATANRPTVVVTHVPLLSNYVELTRGTEEGIPPGIAVVNAHQVTPVLHKHQVKLVLAGHLHVNESFRYKGIEYANIGAVSGNWWRGVRDGFEEGWALLEFRGDDVSWRYMDYGWEVEEAAAAAS